MTARTPLKHIDLDNKLSSLLRANPKSSLAVVQILRQVRTLGRFVLEMVQRNKETAQRSAWHFKVQIVPTAQHPEVQFQHFPLESSWLAEPDM
jgi:hypothetical protein